MAAGKKDVPKKAQNDPSPVLEAAVDAQLQLETDLDGESTSRASSESSSSSEWLEQACAEQGAHPPVEMCADHYVSLNNEMDQNVFFGQLNQTCGYEYAAAVVTAAKKKSE